MWEKYQLSPGHFVILLPSGIWAPIGWISILPDIIFGKSLIISCSALLCFTFQPDFVFVCLFSVQFRWKEDWGEISICGAAEFMNYIVRPMNKQTLMCFNFAGTKKLDSHFVRIWNHTVKNGHYFNIKSGSVDHIQCVPLQNFYVQSQGILKADQLVIFNIMFKANWDLSLVFSSRVSRKLKMIWHRS